MGGEEIILGINLSHDTACAAIVGGEVKVAIAEERLNRVKYCSGLSPFGRIIPFRAIKYCASALSMRARSWKVIFRSAGPPTFLA